MNLVEGKLWEREACDRLLPELETRVTSTLAAGRLDPALVIRACDNLLRELDREDYISVAAGLGIERTLADAYLKEAQRLFSADALTRRLERELGEGWERAHSVETPAAQRAREYIRPLGVLLHIAAGNADGLPAFSVLEGLLTGNINILKLPTAEGGLSVRLLRELIQKEPRLAPYIYVFEYSSRDVLQIRQLLKVADAAVVWGGEAAVTAIRQLAAPNTQIIEWGHKLSFAYVTAAGATDSRLRGIARNIVHTRQLLCSSCQGIYVDTGDGVEVRAFCRRFLPLLEEETAAAGRVSDPGIGLQTALQVYTARLEEPCTGATVFSGRGCSLLACQDARLEPGIGFQNAWVKPLPRERLLPTLRPYKNYLQTVGLACGEEEFTGLWELFSRAGAIHICPGEAMSTTYVGAPHDGVYPLRRYSKIVTVEEA